MRRAKVLSLSIDDLRILDKEYSMEIIDVIQNTTIMEQPISIILGSIFLCIIAFIVGGLSKNEKIENICIYIIYAVMFICVVLVILMFAGVFTVPGEETIVARIEDNYSFSEIYNNYKIVDKDKYSNIYYLVKLAK